MYYKWDNYLSDLENLTAAADVVVAGFGAHPASWGQWSYGRFHAEARRVADVLCRRSRAKPVLFYGAPAWPKAKLVENFRATNARLAAFNGLSVAALQAACEAQRAAQRRDAAAAAGERRAAVPLVNSFGLSSGNLKLSKDDAHYDGSFVVAELAHQVLRQMCAEPGTAHDAL